MYVCMYIYRNVKLNNLSTEAHFKHVPHWIIKLYFLHGENSHGTKSISVSSSFTRWCWHSICLLVVQIFCYLLNFEAARFLFRGVFFFLNFNDEISLSSALSLWLFVPLTVCVNCKLWRRRIRSICPLHCGSSTLLGPHGKCSKFSVLCQKQACTYT